MRGKDYVAVVGAVNVDITGQSTLPMLMRDSNPGRVTVTLGGVGRNIAENLRRLGYGVAFITALGPDEHGDLVRQSCRALDIDISHSLVVPNKRTSAYLCLNDADGEIVTAVNDMAICEAITPVFLSGKLPLLDSAALVAIDANLPLESVEFLARNCKAPIVADPVSVAKAGRLKGVVDALTLIKPNRPEAALLTGVPIRSNDDLPLAARAFFDIGLKNVLISLGAEGVYYFDGHESGILPCFPSAIVNTTGCGDAFIAAAALGYLEGKTLREIAIMGLAASAICSEAPSAVNPDISMEALLNRVNQREDGK